MLKDFDLVENISPNFRCIACGDGEFFLIDTTGAEASFAVTGHLAGFVSHPKESMERSVQLSYYCRAHQ